MTRLEYIRSLSDKELAGFLCDLLCDDCSHICPAYKYCYVGHSGMDDWLKENDTEPITTEKED